MKKRVLLLTVMAVLGLQLQSIAQLVSGNMFLQGRYVEIGSMPNGALGSSVAAPVGYHPHPGGAIFACSGSGPNRLAHVYDFGLDGWTVGTPAYMGDYTLPGSPWEGWAVQYGGTVSYAYQTSCTITSGGTGSWTSYTNSGGIARGVWNGTFSGGALALTQEYRVDTLGSALIFTVKFVNTSAAPITGVYYMRAFDPDNNQTWPGGSFTTTNTIVHQNEDATHTVLVSATATGSSTGTPAQKLGVGTRDCRAKAFIFNSWPMSTACNLANVWSESASCLGTYYFGLNTTTTGDVALGLVYKIGDIAAGDSAVLSMAYAYNGDLGIGDAFPDPTLYVDGVLRADIDTIYPCEGSTVNIDIMNGTDKEFTWSDWTWEAADGLATTTGVSNTLDVSALSGIRTYTISGFSNRMGSCAEKIFTLTVSPVSVAGPIVRDTVLCLNVPILGFTLASQVDSSGTLMWYTTPTGGVGTPYPPTVSTTALGTYTYYVSQNIMGCISGRVPITVTIGSAPDVTAANNGPICQGSTLSLTLTETFAAGLTLTYAWNGPAGFFSTTREPVIPITAATDSGIYTVVVTDNNGCSSLPASTTAVVHATPTSPVFTNPTYCQYLPTVPLSAFGSNILWYDYPSGGTGSTTAPTPSSMVPGVYTYYVTQTRFGCESARYPVIVTVNPKPVPPTIINDPGAYCPGAPFNPFTVVSGTGIRWYTSATGGVGTGVAPVVSTATPGTFTNYASQTVLGCESDRAAINVVVYPPVDANFNFIRNLGCSEDTVKFVNSTTNGISFVWQFGDGYSSTAYNPTHIYNYHIPYTVKLFAYSPNGCIDSSIQNVDVSHTDSARFTVASNVACQSVAVNFVNNSIITAGAATYAWSFGDGTTSAAVSPAHTFTNAGTYNVMLVVNDTIPCYDTAYTTITVDSASGVDLNFSDSVICQGSYVTFSTTHTSDGYEGIVWRFGNGDSILNEDPVVYGYPAAGVYTVSATAYFRACPDVSGDRVFHVYEHPTVNLGPDTTICIGDAAAVVGDYINAATPGATWVWNTGAITPTIAVAEAGTYAVTVNVGGCSSSDELVVTDGCDIHFINTFTPNKDGLNDFFNPRDYFNKGMKTFSLVVYNRWGQKVFETQNTTGRGWDGTFNDVPQPEGVYVYQVEATFSDGQTFKKIGNLTLLR